MTANTTITCDVCQQEISPPNRGLLGMGSVTDYSALSGARLHLPGRCYTSETHYNFHVCSDLCKTAVIGAVRVAMNTVLNKEET